MRFDRNLSVATRQAVGGRGNASERAAGRLLLFCSLILSAGCGPERESGQVEGRVLLDGQPLGQVRVLYLPDPLSGTEGANSSAVTDAQGRYRLSYQTQQGGLGAAVGWHRITVEDIAAENSRSATRPPVARVPAVYSSARDTPLTYRVYPGRQTHDLLLSRSGGS